MDWEDMADGEVEVEVPTPGAAVGAPSTAAYEEDRTVTDKPAPVVVAGPLAPQTITQKHLAKAKAKELLRREEHDRAVAEAERAMFASLPDDPVQRERVLREWQEKAEVEAFARDVMSAEAAAGGAGWKAGDDASAVEALTLTDATSFKTVAGLIAKRVNTASGTKTALAMAFYKELLTAGTEKMTTGEIADLVAVLNACKDKKAAAAKALRASTGKRSRKVNLDKDDGFGGDMDGDEYGDLAEGASGAGTTTAAPAAAEYDFM